MQNKKKIENSMNQEFLDAREKSWDYLSWLGMPGLYDGGLCVTRSLEEIQEMNKCPWAKLEI